MSELGPDLSEVDVTTPNIARIYDYLLGGAASFVIDSAAAGLISAHRNACCPGSALVISNSALLHMNQEEKHGAEEITERTSTPHVRWRTQQEVHDIFTGYELLDPGIVPSARWRPTDPVNDDEALRSNGYAGVGLLP